MGGPYLFVTALFVTALFVFVTALFVTALFAAAALLTGCAGPATVVEPQRAAAGTARTSLVTTAPTTSPTATATTAPTTSPTATTSARTTVPQVVTAAVPAVPAPKRTGAPAPRPTGSSGGCHPDYDPCVPHDPVDVDCEGGSGNGPSYVTGPVRVTGDDVYGLDRDGNGVGCE